ncbi:MAG: zinc-binding dehydrogenase, partial [Planctomycetes bacterium]|nr:zinc-binding dehydrogenase [Planctomycetota bacterium]
ELARISRKLPEDISPEAGGLLCTWREIYSAFTDFHLKPDDAILVFGVGPVGLSFINFAKNWGFRFVACVAPKSPKHEVAKRLGVDALYTPDSDYVGQFLKDAGGKADAVIDAVGNMDIVNNALGLIKNGGTIGVYGVVTDRSPALRIEDGPLNFNLFFHQEPTRIYESAATEPLCQWLREGKVRVDDYLTGEYSLDKFAESYAATKFKS